MSLMSDEKRPRWPARSEMHRARRGKNLAMLAVLLALVVLVFFVTLVRMGG
jgi:hypothetical protein